jgi:hypothetical protein
MRLAKTLAMQAYVLLVSLPCLGQSWEFEQEGNLEGWQGVRVDKLRVEDEKAI